MKKKKKKEERSMSHATLVLWVKVESNCRVIWADDPLPIWRTRGGARSTSKAQVIWMIDSGVRAVRCDTVVGSGATAVDPDLLTVINYHLPGTSAIYNI